MSISRILAVVVVGALLLVAGLTIYNAAKTSSIAANMSGGLHEQRVGEWTVRSNYAAGNLDQHERAASVQANALYEQRVGEWNAGSNYALGNLD